MKKWFNQNKLYAAGAVIGAIAGLLYWKFAGCTNGSCMITSQPFNSALYGALLGSLTLGFFNNNNQHDQSFKQKK
jgi:hypothetical protein